MPKALCYNAVKKGAHCCKYHYNEIFPSKLDPARSQRSSCRCCCHPVDASLPPVSEAFPRSDTCYGLIRLCLGRPVHAIANRGTDHRH